MLQEQIKQLRVYAHMTYSIATCNYTKQHNVATIHKTEQLLKVQIMKCPLEQSH